MMSQTNQTTGAPPLYDFPNNKTLVGLLQVFMRKIKMNTDDMLPATIINYDRTTNTATVQPQIKVLTTDNKLIIRSQLVNVPVFAFGGGNFVINFPLVAGNRGWIKANDRDISLYTQSLLASGPNTFRLHSFEDGLFFPDVLTGFDIAEGDANNMVLQTMDGTTKITLGAGQFSLVTPSVSIIGSGTSIAIESATLTHNGIPIGSTHTHIDVASGTSVSGPPSP